MSHCSTSAMCKTKCAYSSKRKWTLRSSWSFIERSVLHWFGIQCKILLHRQGPKVALCPEFGSFNPREYVRCVVFKDEKYAGLYFRDFSAFRMDNTDSLPKCLNWKHYEAVWNKREHESKEKMETSETYCKSISTVYCIAWRNGVPKRAC